jgi:hypothetical protein
VAAWVDGARAIFLRLQAGPMLDRLAEAVHHGNVVAPGESSAAPAAGGSSAAPAAGSPAAGEPSAAGESSGTPAAGSPVTAAGG